MANSSKKPAPVAPKTNARQVKATAAAVAALAGLVECEGPPGAAAFAAGRQALADLRKLPGVASGDA